MKLLHLDEQRGWRGGEQQAYYLLRGLIDAGHEVYVSGRQQSEFLKRVSELPLSGILPLPYLNEWDFVSVIRLAYYLRYHQIDIIHAHTSHTHTLACLAQRLARQAHVVVSRRVDFPPRPGRFNRWKYNAPDRIIAISGCIYNILHQYGVSEDKLRLVHSAIDPTRFACNEIQPFNEYVIANEKMTGPLLGNVAALAPHKDQATLIEAMPEVLTQYPDAHLLIAGEGKLRNELEKKISDMGLQDNIHLTGFIEDIPGFLKALDVFILSSKEEGLGTSVLDAMACHVPVIATDAGGIPEMVRHQETGLLVPVGNSTLLAKAIMAVLQDPENAKVRCKNAYRMLNEQFSVQRMIDGNFQVYNELTG